MSAQAERSEVLAETAFWTKERLVREIAAEFGIEQTGLTNLHDVTLQETAEVLGIKYSTNRAVRREIRDKYDFERRDGRKFTIRELREIYADIARATEASE